MGKGLFPAIRDFLFGTPQKLRASHYDITRTDPDNARQWDHADSFDSDRANDPQTRQLARNRSRLETDNNPSLKGIVRTIRDYEIGSGPTLHLDHDEEQYAADVEEKWAKWCDEVNFVGKHETMVCGRVTDGEAFARMGINPGLKNPVKLDFQPFECDRVYTLWLPYLTPNRIDGVWFDTWGNPTYYDVLQFHPGGVFPMPSWKFDTIPAQYVLHLFRPERANQHRGMPEMSSSTDLWADRRRFRKATVGAAESAANVGAAMETDQPADDGSAPTEFSTTSMPRNSLVVLPNQYKLKQIDPAHPAQTYEMFSAETLGEAARPMSMALNVAKCNSANYNFAGGRLDITTSWKAVEGNQRNNTQRVTNPIFRAWYAEARLVHETNGRKWSEIDEGTIPAHGFLWMGMPYSDPEAEENADEAAIGGGLKGIQDVYARRGKDWKIERRKNARALGMTEDEYLEALRKKYFTVQQGGAPGQAADPSTAKPPEAKEPTAPSAETPSPAETPEQVEAKAAVFWKTYFPGLADRMNGHANGHNGHKHKVRAAASLVSSVPDIRQDTDYRCGAASAMAVGQYFNVGPDTLEQWSDELGTTAAQSTSPDAIISYLSRLGLTVNARQNMSVDDLAAETAAGRPVIVCCQDYVAQNTDPRDTAAEWDYGHWMTCLAVETIGDTRFLIFQDSSEENMERIPGGDVPPADEDPEYVVEEPGRRFVSEKRWLPAWHDEAVDGRMYDHFGISVGLAESATPAAALQEATP